ncbi:MAG: MBL fold metallo-hydrolase [Lachnospiraceae bacterium]|nr:MBL fold metallo-hydrolase [Lachnospiraceae bacterium]
MKVLQFTLGPVSTNTYIVYDEESKEAVIIDPADSPEVLRRAIDMNGLYPSAILLTHGHFDHIGAVSAMRDAYMIPALIYTDDKELMEDEEANVSAMFGEGFSEWANTCIYNGQILQYLDERFICIATPGHTAGSCCFYDEKDKLLFSGDTLFFESVGRTDFPTGSAAQLSRSIKERLFTLPDDVRVLPGHGPETTIGHEKENNFLV